MNYDPAPNPADVLHREEDVIPMIEATMNTRDAALIATAWDSGARSGEIRSLDVGDVTDHRHGYQLTFQGKTGQRTVTPPRPISSDGWLTIPGGTTRTPRSGAN
jgi:integrase